MNQGPKYQIIAASLLTFAGLFWILWGPDHFRRTIKSGRFSPDEGRAKITKAKIYGCAMIVCGIGLYTLKFSG
jgi:hypothetical protein